MATDVKAGDIMKRAVINVKKNDSLTKIVKIMAQAQIGGVIVTEKREVIGILTEGDIVKDVLAAGLDYKKLVVEDLMKHPVRTISPDIDIEDAARIMRDLDIERLPVVDEKNKLIGLVTGRDLTLIEPALLELMKEKGMMEGYKAIQEQASLSGICERCSNYSEGLDRIGNKFLCGECREL